jgi:hypothetical protein
MLYVEIYCLLELDAMYAGRNLPTLPGRVLVLTSGQKGGNGALILLPQHLVSKFLKNVMGIAVGISNDT